MIALDLHTIIDVPGEIRFDVSIDTEGLNFDSVIEFKTPLNACGCVINSAGLLTLYADLSVTLLLSCDRCATEFMREYRLHAETIITAELQDEDNPDMFLITGDSIDLEDIIRTLFILEMDTKSLCNPDCKGLCPCCGKNLNEDFCSCNKVADSRFAALEQLLDNQ